MGSGDQDPQEYARGTRWYPQTRPQRSPDVIRRSRVSAAPGALALMPNSRQSSSGYVRRRSGCESRSASRRGGRRWRRRTLDGRSRVSGQRDSRRCSRNRVRQTMSKTIHGRDFISQEELRLSWPVTLKKQLLDDCDQIAAKKERCPPRFSALAPQWGYTHGPSSLQLVALPRTPCVSQILENYVKQSTNKKSSMVSKYAPPLTRRLIVLARRYCGVNSVCVRVCVGALVWVCACNFVRVRVHQYACACVRVCDCARACLRLRACRACSARAIPRSPARLSQRQAASGADGRR